jgi:TolC family type I secretion outer membrane protein
MKKQLIIILTSAAFISALHADHLKKALEKGYAQSSDIREKESSLEASHNDISKAIGGWRPLIQATASQSVSKAINRGDSTNSGATAGRVLNKNTRGGVRVQQNLFNGGATVAATNAAEAQSQVAYFDLIRTEQDILRRIIETYLSLWTKIAQEKLLQADRDTLLETLNAANQKFELGEETRTNVAEAEKKYAQGLAQLETVRVEIAQLEATFYRLTGISNPTIEDPSSVKSYVQDISKIIDEKDPAKALQILTDFVKQHNPAIFQARARADATRFGLEQTKAGWLPKVDLSASGNHTNRRSKGRRFRTIDVRTNTNRDRTTDYEATLSMTIPLYEQGQVSADIRKGYKTLEAQRIALQTSTETALEQAIQSWKNYMATKIIIENVKKEVEAAEIALEGAREEMNVGSKILLDVLQAQRELLQSKLRLVEARSNHFKTGFDMLNVMGLLTARSLKLNVQYYDPDPHYQEVRNKWLPGQARSDTPYREAVLNRGEKKRSS